MTAQLSPYEAALRRGMQEFVETQRGPGPLIPELMVQGRRIRRRRRRAAAATAGLVAVAAVLGALQIGRQAAPIGVSVTPSATNAASPPVSLRPRAQPHGYVGPLPQPAHAIIGTAYPYDWFAHCGMVYIAFAGKVWKVDRPVTVPAMHPDANGVTWGPPVVPGYVTLVSASQLRFDAPTYINGVILHRTADTVPLCS